MSDALSFVEIERNYVELLPARTVLSVFISQPDDTTGAGSTGDSIPPTIEKDVTIKFFGDTSTGSDPVADRIE